MRVPLSWLKDFVAIPPDLAPEVLAEKLTLAGLEVGHIDYIGLPQQFPAGVIQPVSDHLVWDDEKIVLGYIHEVKPHPDADRLVLAMVDHGTGGIEQIVTGAPNLYPYKGQAFSNPIPVPIAREGAVVYDGHSDTPGKRMTLKEKAIRGIPNKHMVCSELELGLSESHEGVLLLDYEEFKHAAPGTPLSQLLGDVVFIVDMTPNLARCFSMLGVAREVAALLRLPLTEPDYTLPNAKGEAINQKIQIRIEHPDLNPRFTAALLENVTIKPAPQWMRRRLQLIGQRPINNIVDVTNYVMFEVGQPTHAFDYDILAKRANGKTPVVITRLPHIGEELTTLDGTTHKLQAHNLLVADEAGGLSLGGIMGGLESEVQNATETSRGSQTVLLEAAAWNLINIRKTLSNTKQHSEASSRFSRGVHPAMAWRGLVRAAKLMVEVSGATLVDGTIDLYPEPQPVIKVELAISEVTRLLGFAIPQADVVSILRHLQFEVVENGEVLQVTVPDHRLDIGEGIVGQADLIEDIARIYGYNNIPNTQLSDALPDQRNNVSLEREERVRDLLAQAGLREVISYRLTTPEREAQLTPAGTISSWPQVDYVALANPIVSDKTVMRHTLLAGLLESAVNNARFQVRQAVFEVGNVYLPKAGVLLPDEVSHLAILLLGQRDTRTWQGGDAGLFDFYDLKGILESLVVGLQIDLNAVEVLPTQHSSFRPGRVAELKVGGESIGVFGEVHPVVTEGFGLELNLDRPVLGAELDLERLLAFARPSHDVKAIPTQPAVYQDVSILVDRATPAAEIEKLIWKAGGKLLVGVELFDIYQGEQIPADQKSMAYALTYQHPEETLTDKQVAKAHKNIVGTLEHQLGAKLRG